MRCYFMRDSRIEGVEFLKAAPDEDLIRQATLLFQDRAPLEYDGFEVWDGRRFVYRFETAAPARKSGQTL